MNDDATTRWMLIRALLALAVVLVTMAATN